MASQWTAGRVASAAQNTRPQPAAPPAMRPHKIPLGGFVFSYADVLTGAPARPIPQPATPAGAPVVVPSTPLAGTSGPTITAAGTSRGPVVEAECACPHCHHQQVGNPAAAVAGPSVPVTRRKAPRRRRGRQQQRRKNLRRREAAESSEEEEEMEVPERTVVAVAQPRTDRPESGATDPIRQLLPILKTLLPLARRFIAKIEDADTRDMVEGALALVTSILNGPVHGC
jgi:hypothetical protein